MFFSVQSDIINIDRRKEVDNIMGERQKHGFDFEQWVFGNYGVVPSTQYTGAWDGTLDGIPVSIKVAKRGTDVELADIFRQSKVAEDFILIVGFWSSSKDNVTEHYVLHVSAKDWTSHFDDDCLLYYKFMLDKITNDYSDDDLWKDMVKKAKRMWLANTDNLIRPRFKRDHKSQKRVQCAINNKDFFNHFVPTYQSKVLT